MWFRPFSARNHASFGHKVYHALSKGYSEGSSANSLWGLQDFFFWHSRRIARGLVYCSGCLIKARPPAQPRSYPQALITVAQNGQVLEMDFQGTEKIFRGLVIRFRGVGNIFPGHDLPAQTRRGLAGSYQTILTNINKQ